MREWPQKGDKIWFDQEALLRGEPVPAVTENGVVWIELVNEIDGQEAVYARIMEDPNGTND